MKIKNYIFLVLCFVIGTFLGYQLAEPSSSDAVWQNLKKLESAEFVDLEKAQTPQEKSEIVSRIHEKIFSILLADVAVNLDTKAWLQMLQEEQNIDRCDVALTATSTVPQEPQTSSLAPNTLVSASSPELSVDPSLDDFDLTAEIKTELKNDQAPFVKDGKLVRPTAFFMKSKPLQMNSALMQRLKGNHEYKIANLKDPKKIYRLRVKSELTFNEEKQVLSGKSELELKDEKKKTLSLNRSAKANKFFLYNPKAPETLIILSSPTSFLQLEDQGSEGIVGNFYMQRDEDKKFYLWGTFKN